jgi:AP endonuclease-1
MARKINISEQDSESSLSSAPEDLILSAVEVETLAVRTKRKAVAKEESASEDEAIPKTKTKTKKQPAKKIKVEGENGEITAKKAPTKRRSKKGVVQAPLEERTVGSKLRVGAHVSTAGGTLATTNPSD